MVITVANQKGGQSKSTTAQAIVSGATARGIKALAIDLDPQANLTFSMDGSQNVPGSYELITGQAAAADLIQSTEQGDLRAASTQLASADTILTGNARITALHEGIKAIKRKYKLVVIDTPPTLGTMLLNALAASDSVIIPITADIWSLQGLYLLTDTIRQTQSKYNKKLDIAGVLFTKHSTRTVLERDLADVIKEKCREMQIPVFRSYIRNGVAVREAQLQRESIFTYAPKSNPAQDYNKLLDELKIK